MRRQRLEVVSQLHKMIANIVAQRVTTLKQVYGIKECCFDLRRKGDDDYLIDRYKLVEFGSTMLEVENASSDLDLLLTSFDCILDRATFFSAIETDFKKSSCITQLIIVRNAQVPLAKFKFNGVKVDLIFAEMKTPKDPFSPATEVPSEVKQSNYLLQESSLNMSNIKGADCINSYLSSLRLKQFI